MMWRTHLHPNSPNFHITSVFIAKYVAPLMLTALYDPIYGCRGSVLYLKDLATCNYGSNVLWETGRGSWSHAHGLQFTWSHPVQPTSKAGQKREWKYSGVNGVFEVKRVTLSGDTEIRRLCDLKQPPDFHVVCSRHWRLRVHSRSGTRVRLLFEVSPWRSPSKQ